jgi:hypothetical protein
LGQAEAEAGWLNIVNLTLAALLMITTAIALARQMRG